MMAVPAVPVKLGRDVRGEVSSKLMAKRRSRREKTYPDMNALLWSAFAMYSERCSSSVGTTLSARNGAIVNL